MTPDSLRSYLRIGIGFALAGIGAMALLLSIIATIKEYPAGAIITLLIALVSILLAERFLPRE